VYEDLIAQHVLLRLRAKHPIWANTLTILLNPTRSFANVMAFKRPWACEAASCYRALVLTARSGSRPAQARWRETAQPDRAHPAYAQLSALLPAKRLDAGPELRRYVGTGESAPTNL